jgi:hypothetical protein
MTAAKKRGGRRSASGSAGSQGIKTKAGKGTVVSHPSKEDRTVVKVYLSPDMAIWFKTYAATKMTNLYVVYDSAIARYIKHSLRPGKNQRYWMPSTNNKAIVVYVETDTYKKHLEPAKIKEGIPYGVLVYNALLEFMDLHTA